MNYLLVLNEAAELFLFAFDRLDELNEFRVTAYLAIFVVQVMEICLTKNSCQLTKGIEVGKGSDGIAMPLQRPHFDLLIIW